MVSARICVLAVATHVASAIFQSNLRGHSMATTEVPAECDFERQILLDFATTLHSNLGGMGPDGGVENFVIGNVMPYSGTMVDMYITAQGEYTAMNGAKNTVHGSFGQFGIKCGTKTELKFELKYRDSNLPVDMQPFLWSVFDFDSDVDGHGCESMYISDYTQSWIEPETQLTVHQEGNETWYGCTEFGDTEDNPKHALSLTQVQKEKSVTVLMPAISSWTIKAAVTPCGENGRNILFGGPTAMVCPPDRAVCSSMICPAGHKHVANADHTICREQECTHEMDAARCCEPYVAGCDASVFDFSASVLQHSNLGGMGPDGGEKSLVFGDVYPKSDQVIDMVVTNLTEYTPTNIDNNKLKNTLPQVNIACGTSVALNFQFVNRASGLPADLPKEVIFSVYDFDHLKSGGGVESVRMDSMISFYLGETTQIAHDGPVFSATEWGKGSDNPTDPYALTELQQSRTVSFLEHALNSSLSLTISATEGYQGRNFLFGGSFVLCQ